MRLSHKNISLYHLHAYLLGFSDIDVQFFGKRYHTNFVSTQVVLKLDVSHLLHTKVGFVPNTLFSLVIQDTP